MNETGERRIGSRLGDAWSAQFGTFGARYSPRNGCLVLTRSESGNETDPDDTRTEIVMDPKKLRHSAGGKVLVVMLRMLATEIEAGQRQSRSKRSETQR